MACHWQRQTRVGWLLCAGLLAQIPFSTRAADATSKLAVLEFDNDLRGTDKVEIDRTYFSDQVRGAVPRVLPRIKVMTRENTAEILKTYGRTIEGCVGECEVETGRMLGADYIVSGRLTKVGHRFKLTLRMHRTEDSALISSAAASGISAEELDDATAKAVGELLEPLRAEEAAPKARKRPLPRQRSPNPPRSRSQCRHKWPSCRSARPLRIACS
jgi:TolB-like protein